MPNAVARRRRTRPLPRSFYDRDTEVVARELLGAVLEHRTSAAVASGRIVEVEAYVGPHDPACHAAAGLTRRTSALFGPPGSAYVYFIYGVHWCVNAVTREEGFGSAVLIRALEPLAGIPLMRRRRPRARDDRDLANGPGKVCAALGISALQNGYSLQSGPLRILPGAPVDDSDVLVSPRVGITKAADEMLRFLVADNPFVSKVPSAISARAHRLAQIGRY